jgi:hypothetical protein
MRCPNCTHEPPQADFGDPLRCPKCGVYYAKAMAAQAAQHKAAAAPAAAPAATAARQSRGAVNSSGNDQPVVIVDFQMPFLSMVTFMVKWALASIPALLIVYLLAGMLGVWSKILFS